MKKEVQVVRDPEAVKLAIEDTRNNILSLLRVNDMTISQLADALSKDQSTIYRHIKKLEDAGFVQITGKRKEHHIPEKLFGRTANVFFLTPSSLDVETSSLREGWHEEHAEAALNILKRAGYDIDGMEEAIEDTSEIFIKLQDLVSETVEKPDELEDVSMYTMRRLDVLLTLLEMKKDDGFKEKIDDLLDQFEDP